MTCVHLSSTESAMFESGDYVVHLKGGLFLEHVMRSGGRIWGHTLGRDY